MPPRDTLSVVVPVRDGETRIADEIARVHAALLESTGGDFELIVVDDGSRDDTLRILGGLGQRHTRLRVIRHSKPRGFEAACQTGLEKSTGEIVILQETDAPLRMEDLHKLLEMSKDTTIVAARAESAPRPVDGPLLRRLRASGISHSSPLQQRAHARYDPGLQMLRRPHWMELVREGGRKRTIRSSRYVSAALVAAEPKP